MAYYSDISRDFEKKKVVIKIDIDSPLINGEFLLKDKVLRYKKIFEELKYRKAKVFVLFEIGTSKFKNKSQPSIKEISDILSKLFDIKISYPNKPEVSNLQYFLEEILPGEFFFWENLAITEDEVKSSKLFNKIKEWADFFINDSFSIISKSFNSVKIKDSMDVVWGTNFQKDLETVNNVLSSPKHPILLILGGIQVEDFIAESLLPLTYKVDYVLLTGAWLSYYAYRFYNIGVEDFLDKKSIKVFDSISKDFFKRPNIIFPDDVRVYDPKTYRFADMPLDFVKEGLVIGDLGASSISKSEEIIDNAGTIVWIGSTGKYWIEGNDSVYKFANVCARKISNKILSGDDLLESLNLLRFDDLHKFEIVYGDGHSIIDFMLNKNKFDYLLS